MNDDPSVSRVVAAVDVEAVRFVDVAEPAQALRCTVCGSLATHPRVLRVPSLDASRTALTLLRCVDCNSVFYDPPGIRDFSDLGQQGGAFWRFYVEAGGGVWETIWPILAAADSGSLLDVGCGFGFALDFWKRSSRGDAVGVELADYGRFGVEKLGVTIYPEFLERCEALAGRRFDVVYASEVVEHVPNPKAFISLLSGWVADDGILILTTPNADFIQAPNLSTTLLAALAPGFHGFLLSPARFEQIAREAGFPCVQVHAFGERLMLWASRCPLVLEFDAAKLRLPYFAFLESRILDAGLDASVAQGYAYRLLRDLVNTGRLADGERVAGFLCDSVQRSHGPDTLEPLRTAPRYAAAKTLEEVGATGPFFLPCLYFLLGVLAQERHRDPMRARALFEGATRLIEACARLGSVFFLEAVSLWWPARARLALLDLEVGRFEPAVETLTRLASTGDRCLRENAFAIAPPSLCESTLPPSAERLAAIGRWPDADRIAEAYASHVRRRYGASLTTAEGIEAALSRPGPHVPLDPLFPLWFAGLRDARAGGANGGARSALGEVVRLGEMFARHPSYGARARNLVSAARALSGASAKPVYSFETTFAIPPAGQRKG